MLKINKFNIIFFLLLANIFLFAKQDSDFEQYMTHGMDGSINRFNDWRFVAGIVTEYNSQYLNTQPSNIPSVDQYGNVSYSPYSTSDGSTVIDSSLTAVASLNIIDDLNYSSRKLYGSKVTGGISFGFEKPINDSWLFRIKAMYSRKSQIILDVRTMIYTPQSSSSIPYATVTNYADDTSSSTTNYKLYGIMSTTSSSNIYSSEETVTITQKPNNSYSVSLLYKFSNRFHSGLVITKQKQKYLLQLNETTSTTFKPSITELGFETLYYISDYLSLNSTIHFGKKEKFITRDVNFTVSANSSTYSLSYLPVTNTSGSNWQACNGYLINGVSCTQSNNYNSTTVTDYYVNDSIPTSYGTAIYVNTINSYDGPKVWWSRYFIRASLSLEMNLGFY